MELGKLYQVRLLRSRKTNGTCSFSYMDPHFESFVSFVCLTWTTCRSWETRNRSWRGGNSKIQEKNKHGEGKYWGCKGSSMKRMENWKYNAGLNKNKGCMKNHVQRLGLPTQGKKVN